MQKGTLIYCCLCEREMKILHSIKHISLPNDKYICDHCLDYGQSGKKLLFTQISRNGEVELYHLEYDGYIYKHNTDNRTLENEYCSIPERLIAVCDVSGNRIPYFATHYGCPRGHEGKSGSINND